MTRWTPEQLADFNAWHERRMTENGYTGDVRLELQRAREKFVVRVAPAPPGD